ncbi:NAD-dependent epimerase/dehydratase family protein [Hyphomicrobium sp. B1]|uniref:NAD-dependent epimerase/dehydratase family protein n=1 Tax=Hyphomicrobium sp. B1 TaxID=3075651 RepID=UPI003C2E3900
MSRHLPYHLILGGAGFIGKHVAYELARSGASVRIADRTPIAGRLPDDIASRISFQRCDLSCADWDDLIASACVIYHFAWSSIPASANEDIIKDVGANVIPTLKLLEAIKRRQPHAPRLIFASSGGTVYGIPDEVPIPETHKLCPITGYGAGKAAVELYISTYRALYDLDIRTVRLANPFGAGQNVSTGQGAATTFLQLAISEKPITIWGDGRVIRDYIYISDAVAGILAVAGTEKSAKFWTYNIGSGVGISLNEIIHELEAELGRKLQVTHRCGRAFDVPTNILDISATTATCGWRPRLSFGEGLRRTLQDLQHQKEGYMDRG